MAAYLQAALVAFALTGLLAATGCKQGEGDVCQVTDDCEDGLVCNDSTGRCQRVGSGDIDAAPPVDAREDIDASDIDASPDATPEADAMPDAMPDPDAMIDAGT